MPPFTTCFIYIRFNAIKKGKPEAKGNGFIHELRHMVDEMRELPDGKALCSCPLLNRDRIKDEGIDEVN